MKTATQRRPTAERELTLTRVFDAPRDLMWRMWTKPHHMAQWWGPKDFTNPVCEMDVRPGGAMRIHMRAPDGTVWPMTATFGEVVPPERLVFTAYAVDRDGNPQLESVTTVTFEELGSSTKLTVHASAIGLVPAAVQMLAGMEAGWTQSLERLAALAERTRRMGPSVDHPVVSREKWLAARVALLAKEKEHTRMRDRLSEERRALPWVCVDKSYVFEGESGRETLADLFAGCSQLIVKHFMLAPGQKEGCVGCSFEVDHVEGALVHLEHHDVSYVAVARAPIDEILAFKRRMGWRFKWVSSFGTDFNYDFNVSFTPEEIASGKAVYNYREGPLPLEDLSGLSVFYRDDAGAIFHTYSTFGRGAEERASAYVFLDLTPKGRNEIGPHHTLADWVRHHDRYGAPGHVSAVGRWVAVPDEAGSCCRSGDPPAAARS